MSLIDNALMRRKEKTRPPGVLYVTAICTPCLRSSYMKIVEPVPYPIETLRIFEVGNFLEDYWVGVLRENPDYDVLATQLRIRHYAGDIKIHGMADILVQHRKRELVLHEVKSARSLSYRRNNGPSPDHVSQLQFYMVGAGIRQGQIDYLDKSSILNGVNPIDLSFRVQADEDHYFELISRARMLTHALKYKQPPLPQKSWLCDYCNYKEDCPV